MRVIVNMPCHFVNESFSIKIKKVLKPASGYELSSGEETTGCPMVQSLAVV